jgi:protein SCO1/2
MNKILRNRLVLVVVFVIVTALVAAVGFHVLARKKTEQAFPVNTRMGGGFVLPSTLGKPLDTASLHGKTVLLNFGFTSCPDVCPLVLARLRQVLRELGSDAANTQVLFVSFDPARDTLANLTAYVGHFDARIIGATGSEADIAKIATHYGVVYLKEDDGSASGYGFAHSDYIYLIDAQGRVRKLYSNDAPVAEMVEDVRLLQAADKPLISF